MTSYKDSVLGKRSLDATGTTTGDIIRFVVISSSLNSLFNLVARTCLRSSVYDSDDYGHSRNQRRSQNWKSEGVRGVAMKIFS